MGDARSWLRLLARLPTVMPVWLSGRATSGARLYYSWRTTSCHASSCHAGAGAHASVCTCVFLCTYACVDMCDGLLQGYMMLLRAHAAAGLMPRSAVTGMAGI